MKVTLDLTLQQLSHFKGYIHIAVKILRILYVEVILVDEDLQEIGYKVPSLSSWIPSIINDFI